MHSRRSSEASRSVALEEDTHEPRTRHKVAATSSQQASHCRLVKTGRRKGRCTAPCHLEPLANL
eukprot:3248752-Prorocentrum_lima.AAC.1